MIDIIIPAYNSHKTISKTLLSICLQDIRDLINVYIINDFSNNNYDKEINLFKKYLKIEEISLEKNYGPGIARQIGIDKSNSKYIMFIDSDDILFDEYSISNLFSLAEENNSDVVYGKIYKKSEDGSIFILNDYNDYILGKIYKRQFLIENNIRFNNSRINSDKGFNQLVLMANPKILFSNCDIYLKNKYNDSISINNINKHLNNLKWYAYNIHWSITEAEKRNYDEIKIGNLVMNAMSFMFKNYYQSNKNEKILLLCKNLYKDYLKYKDILYENEKYRIIYSRFNILPDIKFKEFIDKIKIINNY